MTLPAATTKPCERTMNCSTCGMLLPAERPVFHPHVYCLLIKAGVRDPEHYMAATMPLLVEHFPVDQSGRSTEPQPMCTCADDGTCYGLAYGPETCRIESRNGSTIDEVR